MEKILLFVIVFFLCFPYTIYVFAQNPPPAEDVGAQSERFESDIEKKKDEFAPKKTKTPEIKIEEQPAEYAPEAPSFILKKVKITGATVFYLHNFSHTYAGYLNKKVTFKDFEAITAKIKAMYREKGYLTTTVYLPEQEIKDGEIEIRIIEGKMGELNIEGNKWVPDSLLKKYFHIKKNSILNINDLQKDLLRINKNPDFNIKTVISSGKEPQTSDITLKVEDGYPHHVGASVDNFGTRATGKFRESFLFRSTNFSSRNDSLFAAYLNSTHSTGQSISYLLPIDTYGTKLGLDLAYFQMQLGKEYKSLDITGKTEVYTPYILKELCLSERFDAGLKLGIQIKNIKKKTGASLTTHEQLRIPFFAFEVAEADSRGKTDFFPRFNFSLKDSFGASSADRPTSSRAGSGGSFFKYEHSLRRLQKMPFSSYADIRSDFQLASHTMPSSEQFQLGGVNSIRGYPEGDYLADEGISLSLDWIFPSYFIPESWRLGNSDVSLRRQIEPVVFADIGGGKLKKVLSGEDKDKLLAGVGGGLRIRLFNHMYARFEWARRLADRETGGSGPSTFHFVFQSEL